jgi:hypothetical protein
MAGGGGGMLEKTQKKQILREFTVIKPALEEICLRSLQEEGK